MRRRRFLQAALALACTCLVPGSSATALRSSLTRHRPPVPAAGGGDPYTTFRDALLAAGTWRALYIAHDDLASSKLDLSGNGIDLTAPGSEPTYGATSGPNSRPALTFAGSHKVRNTSMTDVNGTRIGMILVGQAAIDGGAMAGIGTAFGSQPAFNISGSNRIDISMNTVGTGFETADQGDLLDSTYRCWALWMLSGDNTAERDGVVFATDFAGSGALDTGSIAGIRWGGDAFSDGTGVYSVFGVLDTPDTTARTAIEDAIADYYGITF